MRKLLFASLLLAALPAFAQLESHTLTVSATRQINLQPDQAVFDLRVNSNAAVGLSQIVAALSGLGITSANLAGVSDYSSAQTLQWSFSLAVPLSNLAVTISSLTKLQQTIAQNNSGLTLTFSINGTQVSAQLKQEQSCSTPDLIADATAQAQKLAAAAGLAVGPILRLSNVPAIQPGVIPADFAVLSLGAFSDLLLASPPPVTCSLAVEFQLRP